MDILVMIKKSTTWRLRSLFDVKGEFRTFGGVMLKVVVT